MDLPFPAARALALLAEPGWWQLKNLRALYGPAAVPLAYARGPSRDAPEYAFFACDVNGARRSLAAFRPARALVTYDYAGQETLNVYGFPSPERIKDLDFAGARLGGNVALFYRARNPARSSVSFHIDAPDKLKYLITGLAPGSWDIWFQGYLENSLDVEPREGSLYFEGDPGGYFLRHA